MIVRRVYNLLQVDYSHLHVILYFYGDLQCTWTGVPVFTWHAPLDTMNEHSRKQSTFKSTNLGRGRGGLIISMLCTNT